MPKKTEEQKIKEEYELNEKLKEIKKNIEQGYADKHIKIVKKRVFDIANDFKIVAETIYKNNLTNSSIKNKLLNPFVVNSVFSIEIYLKIILKKLNAEKTIGHNLIALFNQIKELDIKTYEKLCNDYKEENNRKLSDFMIKYQNAFEDFRYSFEGFNYDKSIDCNKVLLELNTEEIMNALIFLSEYCNKNCKGVSFSE